jgi:pimeloyl-ACP methyl ester carboxylesterase
LNINLGRREIPARTIKKHRVFLFVPLLIAFSFLGCTSAPRKSTIKRQIQLKPCQLSTPGTPTRLQAECGTFSVCENRAAKSGRRIELRVAVISALSRTPEPDPIFFITGGPGEAATEDYVRLSPAFTRLNGKRDIVLVDQRGTGQSHPLKCTSPIDNADANENADLAKWIAGCIKQFDADTRFYNTLPAVDDLDEVRAALGYDKVNLYGISYGTRVAQTYMSHYPKHVRTVILDGVVPQDEALGIKIGSDAQKSLDAVFARCASDADCNRAFPDLANEFKALLRRVEKQPVAITVEHPSTGKPTVVRFTRDRLSTAIRLFSYSPETAALLPLLIHDAQVTGDFRRLAAQSMIVTEQTLGSMNMNLHNSVVCADDVPFYRREGKFLGDAEAESRAYLGEAYQRLEKICSHWPAAQVPPDFKTSVRSEAPVLLLSGQLDPVTPPANADHVAATLPHSLRIVAPGQGHGMLPRGCIRKIATDFIERGTTAGLDARCVNDLKPSPFFLSYVGPKP